MIDTETINYILAKFPVENIWGIGKQLSKRLQSQGIQTALQLRNSCPQTMRERYNVVMHRTIMELRGLSSIGNEDIESKKQILASRSFGKKISDKTSLQESLATHVCRAAEKLRMQNSCASAIQIYIRSSPFKTNEPFYSNSAIMEFSAATADSRKLIHAAHNLLDNIYKPEVNYAKSGVMLLNLCDANQIQTSLFEENDNQHSKQLMSVIDGINKKHGRKTIKFANSGLGNPPWQMQQNNVSPCYTTKWQDIPIVC